VYPSPLFKVDSGIIGVSSHAAFGLLRWKMNVPRTAAEMSWGLLTSSGRKTSRVVLVSRRTTSEHFADDEEVEMMICLSNPRSITLPD
jgi:hypothetical protein